MKAENTELPPSKRSASKTIFAAFEILKENDNQMPRKQLLEEIGKRITFEEWETERYASNGQLKWLTIFLFYTIDTMKAGWLTKAKGIWYLTPKGEDAIKFGPVKLIDEAGKAYREWKSTEAKNDIKNGEEKDLNIEDEQVQQATLEEIDAQATEGIGQYLESIDEHKFQKISAALIRAMGFYIDFIAPPGPDGGIDIIAFKDPLGFDRPRIKVQVKNYKEKNKIDVKPIRELRGLLNANEHIGIFITSSSFTRDAESFARHSDIHIKLIDRTEFIELWRENYHKLSENEKALLPLRPIYFLGSLD